MEKAYLAAKVHFIAGKGGVGKTLISRALASYFADLGYETLFVQLSEDENIAEPPQKAKIIKDSAKKLSYVKIAPDQALFEYLSLKIPSPRVLSALSSHSLFRALCSAMPGLSDLTRLGKIWFHADAENQLSKEIYQKIVVDMPSSGFVSRFLGVAQVVKEATRLGPLYKEASLIDDYFKNPLHARIHLVLKARDIIVNETLSLQKELKKNSNVKIGAAFLNKIAPFDLKSIDAIKTQVGGLDTLNALIDHLRSRVVEEKFQIDRFVAGQTTPLIFVQEHFGELIESRLIEEITQNLSAEF